jgi:hypothetical protein
MSNPQLNKVGKNWDITASRVYSNSNTNLTLDASGNASVFLKTNGTTKLTIDGAGLTTFGTLGSYNPSTNFFTATKFVGDLSGNATNVYVDNSSLSNITYYPTFASTFNSNVLLKADTDYTYNPSTNILSVPTINATSGFQKGATAIVSMVFGSISFSPSGSTTPTSYTITMPSGCDCFNLVSWNPVAGVNNYLTIYDWSLGPWSGPLAANQIRITAALGNGVHLENFEIRFYWRI